MNTRKKYQIAIDLDGVMLAQNEYRSLFECTYPPFSHSLPLSLMDYHPNNIIGVNYDGRNHYYLLLPNLFSMLHYFLISMQDEIEVSFYSASPKKRVLDVAKILIERLAQRAGVEPSNINCNIYSLDNCTMVPEESDLQPNANNDPHIPAGFNPWCYRKNHYKKILSAIFGADISNVILIDNTYAVMTRGETHHHLKVPTFYYFSGQDFQNYATNGLSRIDRKQINKLFLLNELFYKGNLACLAVGTVAEAIMCAKALNICLSQALRLLQVCPNTNKYKAAQPKSPIYEQYNPSFYYRGFKELDKINRIQLFSFDPEFALEELIALCDQYNDFIKRELIEINGYWPPHIYHYISEYHGVTKPESLASTSVTVPSSSPTFAPLSTPESVFTHEPLFNTVLPANPQEEVKHSPLSQKRHSILGMDPTILNHSIFSQSGKLGTSSTTVTSPAPAPSSIPTPARTSSSCCSIS